MKFKGFCIYALCFGAVLPAQPQSLYFHELTVENGLSQADNRYIFQDSRGLVWASSMDGVNRFDGRAVKVWKPDPRDIAGMAGSNVQSNFFEDEKANIWFCTFDALNCYLRREDRIFHIRDTLESGKSVVGYYAFYLDTAQVLWLIEQQQTLRFFDTRTKQFLPARYNLMPGIQKAHALAADATGRKAVLSYRYNTTGACITTLLDSGRIQQRWLLHDTRKDPDKFVTGCWPENDTLIWITHFGGFGAFNPRTDRLTTYFQKSKRSDLYPRDIYPLGARQLLMAFGQKGIFIFDKAGHPFLAPLGYRSDQNVAPIDARNIFCFESGDIFINSADRGISFSNFQKNKFATLLTHGPNRGDAGPAKVRALAEDAAGNTWCLTTDNQLIELNPEKRVTAWHLPNAFRADALPKIAARYLFIDRKNQVCILTWKGLWMLAPGQQSFRQLTGIDQIFLHGLQLKDDRILLTAFTGGIYEMKEVGKKFRFEKIQTIDDTKAYTTLFQDENGLLYACRELTSIAVFDPRQNFKEVATLPVQGEINAWYEPPNGDCFWIATGYGLVKWSKIGHEMTIFNEKNGLPDQSIYAVLPDGNGRFWLSSNRGIIRFDPSDSSAHAFTLADGLPALEFNPFAWLRKRNGELWFGSMAGISTFHPDSIRYLPPPSRVLVTNILVNDQKSDRLVCALTDAHNPMEIRKLESSYSENTLSFEFVAPEYADPAQVRYRYRLEGFDKNWVEAGSRGFARFANLPPGRYVLLLRASNSDGVWIKEPTRLEIEIIPPIWLRWWFILLGLAASIGMIWLAIATYYRRREHIRRLQADRELAVEKERLRISRDLHDDLGSGLGAIGLLSDIALAKTGNAEMSAEVGKIAQSARELSDKVREIIWAASAKNDTLEKLVGYLHQYAMSIFAGSGIELLAQLPAELPIFIIPGERRRALFLAFKEALHNIVKHARATQVDINISLSGKQLNVRVRDNGRGFDAAAANDQGNGLLNMRRRLEEAGGQFLVESGSAGTTVAFVLPL